MAKVNAGCKQYDEDTLRSLLASWQVNPENVEGEGVASDLVRVIRTITQVQEARVRGGPVSGGRIHEMAKSSRPNTPSLQ
jgi:hypothetical protein